MHRVNILIIFFLFLGAVIIGQLFRIQVLHHKVYIVRATEQYNMFQTVEPQRGEIFWKDGALNDPAPLVVNKTNYDFYIVPKHIEDIPQATKLLAHYFGLEESGIVEKFSNREDPYELVAKNISEDQKVHLTNYLKVENLPDSAYGFEESTTRFYVEAYLASHVTGFLGFADDGVTRIGQYGAEEWFHVALAGTSGLELSDKDIYGRPIAVGTRLVEPVVNGADIFLTIDKNIQYNACSTLKMYVQQLNAVSGTVIIMDPETGEILALCGVPDFDPNTYGSEDAQNFLNSAVSVAYEPGSIMKPITMAAALDVDSVTPWSTYSDTGEEKIDRFTIRNADGKAHGINTMIDVLDKSLNTGAIFAMRKAGRETFVRYIDNFGFGKLTGIELAGEVSGDIKPANKGEIFAVTASYGQGITVTPLQMVVAYAAIARGGKLVKPTIVEKVQSTHFEQRSDVHEIDTVISQKTAQTLTMMLVSAVKNGYASRAGVPGYRIAGKTGTAQIPKKDGAGYSEETIHSFIGFGPVGRYNTSAFVMLVKIEKPQNVRFATESAAPLFGEIAQFLVRYLEIPPDTL